MWMDGGAGKSGVSHGFRAGVSGVAIEHENVQDIILQTIHYLCYKDSNPALI